MRRNHVAAAGGACVMRPPERGPFTDAGGLDVLRSYWSPASPLALVVTTTLPVWIFMAGPDRVVEYACSAPGRGGGGKIKG